MLVPACLVAVRAEATAVGVTGAGTVSGGGQWWWWQQWWRSGGGNSSSLAMAIYGRHNGLDICYPLGLNRRWKRDKTYLGA